MPGQLRAIAIRVMVTAIVAALLVPLGVDGGAPAQAAVGSQFDPGLIISDSQFYDGGAMSSAQVQVFLSTQVTNCAPGYVCLKDYRESTVSRPAVADRCAAYSGESNEPAAQIIAKVGAACGISQKTLLVLLQKEQSLVTSTAPSASKYRIATGYGCPDTSACDTTYYGFSNQVYLAAKQFKTYLVSSESFRYKAQANNQVDWHPDTARCGSSNVYIQNSATAGLYNYTPYQPNAAALDNLYGIGDSCSSYGNRNFWRIYSDWFGSPTVGNALLKAVGQHEIYFVSGSYKYYIGDPGMLASYSVFGGLGIVSPSVINSYITLQPASYIIRDGQGAIFLHDGGTKYPLHTCELVADFGGNCNPGGNTQITDFQASQFKLGVPAGNLIATNAGRIYYVAAGVKHEVLDGQSLTDSGIAGTPVAVTEALAGSLPTGQPLIRNSVFVRDNTSGGYAYLEGGKVHPMNATTAAQTGASSRVVGSLTSTSLATLPQAAPFTGFVSSGGRVALLTDRGAFDWPLGVGGMSAPLEIGAEVLGSYVAIGAVAVGSLVQSPGSYDVILVTAGSLRWVTSWEMVVGLAGSSPTILPISSSALAVLPQGQPVLSAGKLVRTETDYQVYLLDGASNRVPLNDFATSNAMGVYGTWLISQQLIEAYAIAPAPVGGAFLCQGVKYIAGEGSVHRVTDASLYPVTYQMLEPATCNALPRGASTPTLIRTAADGAIYTLDAGTKRWITNPTRYAQLGSLPYLNVSAEVAAQIPTGPVA